MQPGEIFKATYGGNYGREIERILSEIKLHRAFTDQCSEIEYSLERLKYYFGGPNRKEKKATCEK